MRRYYPEHERGHRNGKMVFGIVVALLGVLFLLRQLDVLPYFHFHMIWPYFLIVIGVIIGLKSRFRSPAPWILIFIGVVNSIDDFPIIKEKDIYASDLIWPLALIMLGIFIALKPHRAWRGRRHWGKADRFSSMDMVNDQSTINIDVVFGGRKEIITNKDFKGGTVQATFGGCELNLMQADATQPIEMDVKVAFGGVEIIIPSHWELQNEISPSFGSVEDHRMIRTPNVGEEKKVLILRGSVSFGSVEIKAY